MEHTNDLSEHAVCDSLSLYMNEMRPRLTPAEEKELIDILASGQAAQTSGVPVDTVLIAAAKQQLIEGNLRLVVHVAHKYTGHGLPLNDLIQEGNLGLMHAADLFNPMNEQGAKFSTYASSWILQKILYALKTASRTICLPIKFASALERARKAQQEFSDLHGRLPAPEELATFLKEPIEEVWVLLSVQRSQTSIVSLDTPITPDHRGRDRADRDRRFQDALMAHEPVPEVPLEDTEAYRLLQQEATALLKPRDYQVLWMRFESQTYQEIAEVFNLTPERIRQIEKEVVRKLSQHACLLAAYCTSRTK